jgi:hypothetical protein
MASSERRRLTTKDTKFTKKESLTKGTESFQLEIYGSFVIFVVGK